MILITLKCLVLSIVLLKIDANAEKELYYEQNINY